MAQQRNLTVEDLWAMKRVSTDISVSPDGKTAAYVITTFSMENNSSSSNIWLANLEDGSTKQLTNYKAYHGNPRWSPDGKKLAFLSSRCDSVQIFAIDIDGGEAKQISKLPVDVSTFEWMPDGKGFLFTADVYPNMTIEESAKEEDRKSVV